MAGGGVVTFPLSLCVVVPGPQVLSHSTHSSEQGGLAVARGVSTPDGGCLALVVRTGMYTSQGDLMRTIQFSSDRMTVGNKEAFQFILVRPSGSRVVACVWRRPLEGVELLLLWSSSCGCCRSCWCSLSSRRRTC